MAKGKSRSKGQKALYTQYKANEQWHINRELRLEKHKKKHPNDLQAKAAKIVYRRNKHNNGTVDPRIQLDKLPETAFSKTLEQQFVELGYKPVRRRRRRR